jgi:hypothetical protein
MRGLLHVLAILLALPQLLLSLAFLLLGHVTSGGTLGSLAKRMLDVVFALFTWAGLLAIVLLLILMIAGYDARTRRAAAALVAALIIASAVLLIVQLGPPPLDALLLFVPGLFALVISIALTGSPRLQSRES